MAKLLSQHTKFEIQNSAGTYVRISGIKTWKKSGGSTSIIDASDLDSVQKEKLPGLGDAGSFQLDGDHIAADAGQIAIEAARVGSLTPQFRVTYPDNTTDTMTVIVVSTDGGGAVDQIVSFSAKLEISGSVVAGTASSGS